MRILTILLAALLALLPDCTACLLCGMEGGPCSAIAEACCEGEACPAPGEGASDRSPCTCGSACDDGCLEPDAAPSALSAAALPPPSAIASLPPSEGCAPVLAPAPAARAAGPPTRLPLRI